VLHGLPTEEEEGHEPERTNTYLAKKCSFCPTEGHRLYELVPKETK